MFGFLQRFFDRVRITIIIIAGRQDVTILRTRVVQHEFVEKNWWWPSRATESISFGGLVHPSVGRRCLCVDSNWGNSQVGWRKIACPEWAVWTTTIRSVNSGASRCASRWERHWPCDLRYLNDFFSFLFSSRSSRSIVDGSAVWWIGISQEINTGELYKRKMNRSNHFTLYRQGRHHRVHQG